MTTMTCTFHGLDDRLVAQLVGDAVDQVLTALDSEVETLDGCDEPVAAWCRAISGGGHPIVAATVVCDDAAPVGTVGGAVRAGTVSVDLRLAAPVPDADWEAIEATPDWAQATAFFTEIRRDRRRPARVVARIVP